MIAITPKIADIGIAQLIPSLPNTDNASTGIGSGFERNEINAIEI